MSYVVSFRLSEEEIAKFDHIVGKTKRTASDVVRAMLADPKITSLVDRAYDKGYSKGRWKVSLPCSICKKLFELDLTEPKAKETLERAFASWGHGNCVTPPK